VWRQLLARHMDLHNGLHHSADCGIKSLRVGSLYSPDFHLWGGQAGVTKGHSPMSSISSYNSSPWLSRTQPGPVISAGIPTHHDEQRPRHGLRRRGRDRSGTWTCLGCGLPVTDLAAAGLGFCPRCQDFTGLCGAGRRLVCPDVMTWTTWHTPCTSRGAAAWLIGDGTAQRALLLCPEHDAQLRAGQAGWIRQAIPLESPVGWQP